MIEYIQQENKTKKKKKKKVLLKNWLKKKNELVLFIIDMFSFVRTSLFLSIKNEDKAKRRRRRREWLVDNIH